MKKSAVITLILCVLSFNACAQWYIFPGNKKTEEKAKTAEVEKDEQQPHTEAAGQQDAFPEEIAAKPDVYEYQGLETIHAALILPLQASTKPSANFFEMYSGALMAVRDAAGTGSSISLSVYDSADSHQEYNRILEDNDLILGPVSVEDIYNAAKTLPEDKRIISPLEPKAAGLADSLGVIHAPSPWSAQIDEVVPWLASDLRPMEKVVVIKDPKETGEQTDYLLQKLSEMDMECVFVDAVTESAFDAMTSKCIIASDRDDFLSASIRSLTALLALGKDNITLYGTSKTRSAATDTKTLHSLNAHMVLGYYTDYENPKVKDFVLKYRAVFDNEPGSFAFQGYDTMHYFLGMCSLYGRQWYKKLPDFTESGLQSGFRFRNDESKKGFVNSGVRRVVFGRDLSTILN